MKKEFIAFAIVVLLMGISFVSAATTLTVKGRLVDQTSGQGISGAMLGSAYEFSPSEYFTDSNGDFQFTITDAFNRKEGAEAGMPDVGGTYTFFDSEGLCHDYGYVALQKNYEIWSNGQKTGTYGLALRKNIFGEGEQVTDVSGKTTVDVGDIKMNPRAHIATQSDIEASIEIFYKKSSSTEFIGGGGQGGFDTEHAQTVSLPLDYDVYIRFTDEQGRTYQSTTFHVPADAKCKTISLNYENGQSSWTVGSASYGGVQIPDKVIEINVRKGWNLVPFNSLNIKNDSGIQLNDIRVQYLYFTPINKYIQTYPEKGNDAVAIELQNSGIDQNWFTNNANFLLNLGAWLYSDKSGVLKIINNGDPLVNHKQVGLKTGWNFKTISLSMVNKKFSEVKGSCNILRVAEWKQDSQQWDVKDYADVAQVSISKGDVNEVAVFKVTSDCQFGDSSSITPPAIPQ